MAGVVAGYADSGFEAVEGLGCRDSFDLSPIGAGVSEFRVSEAVLESAVVGEEEESFGVVVEAAGGVDVGDGDEVGEGWVALGRGGELAEDAVGFIEEEIDQSDMVNYV